MNAGKHITLFKFKERYDKDHICNRIKNLALTSHYFQELSSPNQIPFMYEANYQISATLIPLHFLDPVWLQSARAENQHRAG